MSFMLLGILNSQAAGGGAGAFDLLETTTLTSSASSVTFSGLDAYSDYKHLQIRATLRNEETYSDALDTLVVQFNSDTGTNYATHSMYGDGSSVVSFGVANTSAMSIQYCIARAASPSSAFGLAVIDILDFSNTSKNKTMRSLSGGVVGATQIALNSGVRLNTEAITTINLKSSNPSNLVSGCRFSLYGRA